MPGRRNLSYLLMLLLAFTWAASVEATSNSNGKWALHYAGPHDGKANTCWVSPVTNCEDIIVDAPSTPGRYDIYILAVDVDEVGSTRFGLSLDGPFIFYGWWHCAGYETATSGWPGDGQGNAIFWYPPEPGPHVNIGIMDVYVYGNSTLSTGPDPRVGYAEWCDGASPTPICYQTTSNDAFSTVSFGGPGYIACQDSCFAPQLAIPVNGSDCAATEVVLDWLGFVAAVGYEVQIGMTCGSGTVYGVTESEKEMAALDPDTEYHWRVRAECASGWGPWSPCWSFNTSASPTGTATLISPPAGATDQPRTVTLQWDCVPGAPRYEVQIGTSCGTGDIYSTTSCSETISGLDRDTEYCWRVRAKSSCGGWGDWSSCSCFQTLPPADNSLGKWALHFAGPHNQKLNSCYSVPISDCEDIVVDAPSTPGHYDIYILAADVDEVASTRFGLKSDGPIVFYGWGNCADYYYEDYTPGWPGDGEGNAISWSTWQQGPHVNIGILDVYLYGNSTLSTGPDPRVGYAEWCDAQSVPICYQTTANDAFSTVGFGAPGYIACLDSCFAPQLATPGDGSDCAATEVVLDWHGFAGAQGYEVQIGTSCGSGTVYSATSSEKTVSGLDPYIEYHWRVRAECPSGWGPWSACWSFIATDSPPPVPALSFPPNGIADQTRTVTLKWDSLTTALRYEVQLGTSCGAGTIYSTTFCAKTISSLSRDTEYWWRVRAKSECGTWSEWSGCWSFRTSPIENSLGKWALHYAGPHSSKRDCWYVLIADCEDVIVNAPSGAGHYDIYIIAVDVDEIKETRFGLYSNDPSAFHFYGWTGCGDWGFENPTEGWPACGEGNHIWWYGWQPGPYVNLGILDVYVYNNSALRTGPDPRVGHAEWCDGEAVPNCLQITDSEAFSTVGFGMPGYILCEPLVPVGLAAFEATATGEGILLEWATGDISDFAHFFVRRNTLAPDGDYLRLHEKPIDDDGTGTEDYSYLDTDVIPGTLYYYKLEAVRSDGGSVFFGPRAAVAAELKAQYRLAQNVPNPFSRGGKTTIQYSVAKAGRIQLRILDVSGRLVRTITQEAKLGDNWVTWDGTDENGRHVASGVYFYEIRAGDFTAERKMLLIN